MNAANDVAAGSSGPSTPDHDLDETRTIGAPDEIRAAFHPVRGVVLDLLLERAASVAELADALGRPKSTVAHHVRVLLDAGLVRVVRTRRVRAIDERFYGRTARHFVVGAIAAEQLDLIGNALVDAATESAAAHAADDLRAIHRHVRVPRERAVEFWQCVVDLAAEFVGEPRAGDQVWAFVAGLYPTEHPVLPPVVSAEDVRAT
ncbi:MAG: winged helix-turn-helix transcriptional regulator [Acidimicrobiales bacterium]|nr:winged helix-turn-helix transcriptional regulator [Acidimicrobiales bacterium]MCB9395154.1 winged helix-turn-helix transcriptional regulator [Acidimicrobiaceae bacterium]